MLWLAEGPLSTNQVAQELGVTDGTARHHLIRFQAEGLVSGEGGERTARQGYSFPFHDARSRPRFTRTARLWSLTEEGVRRVEAQREEVP